MAKLKVASVPTLQRCCGCNKGGQNAASDGGHAMQTVAAVVELVFHGTHFNVVLNSQESGSRTLKKAGAVIHRCHHGGDEGSSSFQVEYLR